MKRLIKLLVILTFIFTLTCCSKSTEEISYSVRSSIQKEFDTKHQDLYLKITDLQVLKNENNKYIGIAKIEYLDKIYDIPVDITVNGDDFVWVISPNSFPILDYAQNTNENSQQVNPSIQVDSKETNNLIFVQGGSYLMGSNEGKRDEKPIHEVILNDFYISKSEVTLGDWYKFLKELEKTNFEKAKSYTTENINYDDNGELQIFTSQVADKVDCPVNSISWYAAVEYCNWLSRVEILEECYKTKGETVECNFNAQGYRLPTEAEWEYAAKGGVKSQGYKYSGNANYLKVAWMEENSNNKTHSVCTKDPNELGIYDMSGNIDEWCWDWYSENYYSISPILNPKGINKGTSRVVRGGRWDLYGDKFEIRTSYRTSSIPISTMSGLSNYGRGFRVVKAVVNLKSTQESIQERLNEIESDKVLKKINIKTENEKIIKKIKEQMILLNGGLFTMGKNKTKHDVRINGFYISKYEITQEQYKAVTGDNPSKFKSNKNPVESISWYEAIEFCNKLSKLEGLEEVYKIDKNLQDQNNLNESDNLKYIVEWDKEKKGYRLPTEAEWEFAAGGFKTQSWSDSLYIYSGSNNIDEVAWHWNNSNRKTHPVGTKKANELELFDMSGNVWEWCWDWYAKDYYSSSIKINPTGPESGKYKVLRGGSWEENSGSCHEISFRNEKYYSFPGGKYSDEFGFRIVRSY